MNGLLLAAEGGAGATNEVVVTAGGAIGIAWLIPILPLLGFATILALSKQLGERSALVANAAAGLSFLLSIAVFVQVLGDPATHVRELPVWLSVGSLEVSYTLLIDQLTSIMLLVVTGVGFLVHVYSIGYMHGDERFPRFFAYLNLFMFSMLVLVLGSNFLVLFLGWELVGLSSYLLIGFWFEDMSNAVAAKKAFITNRVGDVSFMVGMFLIFATYGSLEFLQVLPNAGAASDGVVLAIVLLLVGGAVAKSAQIPLYVWLPDAMAGPTPVSALIHAATMVTAGVYLLVRSSPLLVQSFDAMQVIAWIGISTALLAALIAIRQNDIKKILAYSTISQLGYMFAGVGVGGFDASIFHLTTHAFFKGLLFLAAGSVMHAVANETNAWRMGGLKDKLPITFWTSVVAVLAISGIPPFAGFWSKDEILHVAFEHDFVGIWVLGVITAGLTAFYMGRWLFLIFFGEPRHPDSVHPHESPPSMTVPLVILGVLSLVGGFVNWPVHWFSHFLDPAAAGTEGLFTINETLGQGALILIAALAGVLGLTAAWLLYGRRDVSAGEMAEPIRGPVAELMERKFFVDELYEAIFVRAGGRVAEGMRWFDANVVDGLVNGAGTFSQFSAQLGRRIQTGVLRGYAAGFVAGAVVLFAVLLIQVR